MMTCIHKYFHVNKGHFELEININFILSSKKIIFLMNQGHLMLIKGYHKMKKNQEYPFKHKGYHFNHFEPR